MNADEQPTARGSFPSTHWSAVLAAGHEGDSRAAEALAELCRTYWFPLYAFLRRRGSTPEDAQDLTQGFFAHLVESELVGKADAAKGRFRTFLLSALTHFCASEYRRSTTVKRGGPQRPLSLDWPAAEARYGRDLPTHASPELLYERQWALTILSEALEALREEYRRAGRGALFDRLHPWLQGDEQYGDYAGAARELGASENSVRTAVHRMRQRYRAMVRAVILPTVGSEQEVEEELAHLLQVLRG